MIFYSHYFIIASFVVVLFYYFILIYYILRCLNEKRRFYFVCIEGLIYRTSCSIKSKYECSNFPFVLCTDLYIRIILALTADNSNKRILLDIKIARKTTDQNNRVSNQGPTVHTPAKAREARNSQYRVRTRNSRAINTNGLGLRGKCAKWHNDINFAKMRTPGRYNAESDVIERTPAVEVTPLVGSVAAGASRRLAIRPMMGRRDKGYKRRRRAVPGAHYATDSDEIKIEIGKVSRVNNRSESSRNKDTR